MGTRSLVWKTHVAHNIHRAQTHRCPSSSWCWFFVFALSILCSLHCTELREDDTEGMDRYDGFTLKKQIRDSWIDETPRPHSSTCLFLVLVRSNARRSVPSPSHRGNLSRKVRARWKRRKLVLKTCEGGGGAATAFRACSGKHGMRWRPQFKHIVPDLVSSLPLHPTEAQVPSLRGIPFCDSAAVGVCGRGHRTRLRILAYRWSRRPQPW
jgi:hypothetical protein